MIPEAGEAPLHIDIPFLQEIILFLVATGLVMPVVRKFNISPVLGFLCIGLLIGPFGLGRLVPEMPALGYLVITETEGVQAIGELGVMFLLFSIGLEMSFAQIWGMRRTVFGLGTAQILVSAMAIAGILLLFEMEISVAILLGLCLALSSTAIVMQLLSERLRLGSREGRTAFAILLMQDLAVVPILFLVSVLATSIEGPVWSAAFISIAEVVGIIAAIFLTGRVIVRPLLRLAVSSGGREIFMASVLLIVLGTSALTAWAGLSMVMGAFLAGLIFAGTEYRHQINSDIEPFKGLLLALFFISVGMRLDVLSIWTSLGAIMLAALALMTVKAAVLFILTLLHRRSVAVAAEIAILLSQGGEFAIIAVSAGLAAGLLDFVTAQFVILIVVLTMFATPGLEILGRRVGAALGRRSRSGEAEIPGNMAAEQVVIGGFGRVGKMLGKILEDQRISYVAVERDAGLVAREKSHGTPVFYGDASDPELLKHIGIRHAAAFVTTMDQGRAAEAVVSALHRSSPHVPIYARARDPDHARKLTRLGAVVAVPETTEASLQLSEALLSGVGMPDDVARAIVEDERARLFSFDAGDKEEKRSG